MSQMKPYCFKCGAELEPEAIYCPECGRLQRSMVVRSVDPNDQGAPPAPYSGSSHEQPYQLYPDRDAAAAEQVMQFMPEILDTVRGNRQFLVRAVRFLRHINRPSRPKPMISVIAR